MSTRPLLLEIGCEELPSSSLRQLGEALHSLLVAKLAEKGLQHGPSRWFASPRRLAVLIEDLIEQGADESQEALGPPVAQAKDKDGSWSRAAEGFAARQGVAPEALSVIDTPKGPRLGVQQVVAGVRSADCLGDVVSECLAELPIAKRMRWGSSRREFARPVHWIVLLFGAEHGFGPVMGIESGNTSYGHRFHAPEPIGLANATDYESALLSARVIADFAKRCEVIRDQVEAVAKSLNAHALIDEDLLGEVASLVEWPVALSGSFDTAFLDVPAEALISSMQSHQKYFPVVDANGSLLPHFITVSNIESKDPGQVIAGNERVIRPRLADAAFFFNQDRQHRLDSRVERLGTVVFQQKLGTVLEKSHRVQRLAGLLAEQIGADPALAERAALLCKADLVSDMVLEFGDMQGIAGAYYARHDGEDALVADAIAQHYWPTQAGSALPRSPVSTAVALADRLDTLVGIFGIGQAPTGSKDPFALRRASIAVLRIMVEKELPLDLQQCLDLACAGYAAGLLEDTTATQVLDYMLDRLPALYESEGLPIEVFRAVRAAGCTQPFDFALRLRAVQRFSARREAEALAAANKRVSNILAKADNELPLHEVNTDLLREAEEIALFGVLETLREANAEDLANANYADALARLADLRDPVDAFFDGVMVNADDPQLKANRLALLAQLRGQFLAIADVSLLAS